MSSRTVPLIRSADARSSSRVRRALLAVTVAIAALAVVVAALAAVAVVGAIVLKGNRGSDSEAATALGAPFGAAHVHGLGIDP